MLLLSATTDPDDAVRRSALQLLLARSNRLRAGLLHRSAERLLA